MRSSERRANEGGEADVAGLATRVDGSADRRDLGQRLVVRRWRAVEPDAMGFRSRLPDIVARERLEGL